MKSVGSARSNYRIRAGPVCRGWICASHDSAGRSTRLSMGRHQTGSLRQLPSGRIPVRHTGPDGRRRAAPQTFPNRALARRWLAIVEADMVRRHWRNSSATTETLRVYALRWVVERELSDRTRELYLGLLERQVLPIIRQCRPVADDPATSQNVAARSAGLRYWRQHSGQGLPVAPCRHEHSGR